MRNNFSYHLPLWIVVMLLCLIVGPGRQADAFTLNVAGCDKSNACTTPVSGFRWVLEEDNTNQSPPGVKVNNSIGLSIHNSYAPVVLNGSSAGSSVDISVPDPKKKYYVTVLPDGVSPASDFALSGAQVAVGQAAVTVKVHKYPIPTAQISVLVFKDHNPINNIFDGGELGLEGWTVLLFDQFGDVTKDAFGNPLGSTYLQNCQADGQPTIPPGEGTNNCLNPDGSPVVLVPGSGVLTTDATGSVYIKYLPPGKYGIRAVPLEGEDPRNWVQTSTMEGTPGIDAWVKANEPAIFIEGFGTGFYHAFIGFVKPSELPWATAAPGGVTVTGRNVFNHFGAPPANQGFFAGAPVSECWIGLNDVASQQGLIAVPCDADSNFTISGVPAGSYQLVTWDKPLDALFGFNTITVADADLTLGNVLSFRWFGTLEGSIFYDTNQNGFQDVGEPPLENEAVNIRYRDGSMYQATTSDLSGEYAFSEVFPFFKWLIVESGFTRFKPTGMTAVVDAGGQVLPHNGWIWPSFDALNPQPQVTVPGNVPIINPNTANNLSKTETGPVLLEAMMLFLNQTNVIDWGKVNYSPGENGGITGVIYYATTRAEDDVRLAAAETWEPGVPRVQVNLYEDFNDDGVIDDKNGNGTVDLADVDNYPFAWSSGKKGKKGSEDIDWNNNKKFDKGDAVKTAWSDSWDDNKPTGCIQTLPPIPGVQPCYDNYGTWNQVRPGVFDGGYGFGFAVGDVVPAGLYIVQAVPPPGYLIQKEEDKNVDFGDAYTPGPLPLAEPPTSPACVGTGINRATVNQPPMPLVAPDHVVPAELVLFPGVPAVHAGETMPLCNMKKVRVADGKNAAADFFVFTEVPKAARSVGFVNNDLSAEFRAASPIFGEKSSPSWIPISYQDWQGNEVARVYSDEFGSYNTLLPSTFTINPPIPTGVSPNMITTVLNHPLMPDGTLDPFYDPAYSITPWTLDYWPGKTTYLDTPLVPVAAFAGFPYSGPDVEPSSGTPVIKSVDNDGPAVFGPVVCPVDLVTLTNNIITLTSVGNKAVPDPDAPVDSRNTVTRDYGFGTIAGTITVNGSSAGITINSWTNESVNAVIDTALVGTGQLMLIRGDNNRSTDTGITLHVTADCVTGIRYVAPSGGNYTTIQAAVDDLAPLGGLVVVASGTYNENVFLYGNVKLQGSGAGSTNIFASPQPIDRLTAWHDKEAALGVGPFTANEAPGIMVLGETATPPITADPALIDGFNIFGAIAGGGISVNGDREAPLQISNNRVTNNQGNDGGGITVGSPAVDTSANSDLTIIYNYVVKNGGIQGGGGVVLYAGADNYVITNNVIGGNFSRFFGGGISHSGLSNPGLIRNNKIIFNEVAFGGAAFGDGAGICVGGEIVPPVAPGPIPPPPAFGGAGNVTIDRNLIQGNLAGVGRGGGIMALYFNGTDVEDGTPYTLTITNNMIVNNVAGFNAGGIGLQDVEVANISNNTIVNNDSTGTAANAFPAGSVDSVPYAAGIVSNIHSTNLQASSGHLFSNPVLQSNIIWGNRSFYTLNGGVTTMVPASGAGASYPDIWDLQVVGVPTPEHLSPENCLLSNLLYTDGNDYTVGNIESSQPRFARTYNNQIVTAAVIDEGGNFITVRFTPLKTSAGDYHVRFNSPVVNAGTLALPTAFDFDGEARPNSTAYDIGADEFYAPVLNLVTLFSPNGGEVLTGGGTFGIYWGVNLPNTYTHYALQYSTRKKPGKWITITDNLSTDAAFPSLGYYDWTVPILKNNKVNTHVWVRIVAHSAGHGVLASDFSDAPFTVNPAVLP